jgi:hypothetical protein
MYPRDVRVENPQEALIVEQALAMYREMRDAAAQAADGEVLNVAESLAVARGRELMRRSLETVLQQEAEAGEKKRAGATLRLRRRGRTSRPAGAVGPDGGRRGEVATRVLRLPQLSFGSARRGRAVGHCQRAQPSSGAAVVFGRRELVVRSGQRVSR